MKNRRHEHILSAIFDDTSAEESTFSEDLSLANKQNASNSVSSQSFCGLHRLGGANFESTSNESNANPSAISSSDSNALSSQSDDQLVPTETDPIYMTTMENQVVDEQNVQDHACNEVSMVSVFLVSLLIQSYSYVSNIQ